MHRSPNITILVRDILFISAVKPLTERQIATIRLRCRELLKAYSNKRETRAGDVTQTYTPIQEAHTHTHTHTHTL